MFAIEINNLVKEYNNGVKALDNLNLKVRENEIFSLLGPNGAGKSSLINILTTYYKQTSGEVKILGKDLCNNPAWIRTQIACVAQQISIDAHLSLKENMMFQSRLYNVDQHVAKERINFLIDSFNLSDYLNYPTSSYSGGVKRRLDIAMNLVSLPKILFLDEPTVGMDVQSRKDMWKMLLKIRDQYGVTIFLTTHYLEEAEELSDTICIMKDGKEIVQGKPDELRSYTRKNIIRIEFPNVKQAKINKAVFENMEFTKLTYIRDNSLFINVNDSKTDFLTVNRWLLSNNVEFNAIEVVEPSLEDVFLSLTDSEKVEGGEFIC